MIHKITNEIFEHVMQKKELEIYFQPIVSLNKERMIGCEALMRASFFDESIAAESMFNYARKHNQEYALDTLCREIALKQYLSMNRDILIFINFESTLLQEYINHMEQFIQLLQLYNIEKEKIVIEINEKRTGDDNLLVEFVTRFRKQGFLIALDDVGEGHSNYNRIILTKPDIIKIDRKTIKGLQYNYYKYEILRSITSLASRIGAVVVAEGVEDQDEALSCLSVGIDMIQGYYFSKALEVDNFKKLNLYPTIHQLSCLFRTKVENNIIENLERGQIRKSTLYNLIHILQQCDVEEYEAVICSFFDEKRKIECIYIMDTAGKQITNTLFCDRIKFKSIYLFSPAKMNDYHSLKPYYYVVKYKKSEIYVSDRYISAATGHFCETYSCVFYSSNNEEFILCIDYAVDEWNK